MNQINIPNPELQAKRSSKFTTIITTITIVFLLFVAFKKFDNIALLLSGPSSTGEVTQGLQIGQQISVEGTITANGDLANYTHQLKTLSSGIYGLKSKNIDLNQYSGTIIIEGSVEKDFSGIYIIDVISVIGNMAIATTGEDLANTTPDGVYLEKAGIQFPQAFMDNYTLTNNGENNVVLMTRTSNGEKIKINYFLCKKGDPNDDCAQLKKNFASMIEKTITTTNNDKIIKLTEQNSWFVTNDLFGYFINDIPAQEVTDLSNYIVFPNKTRVEANLTSKISSICVDGLIKLEQVEKTTLIIDNNKIAAKVAGKVNSGNATCTIAINPSLPALGTKVNFYYPDSADQSATTTLAPSSAGTNPSITKDPSIKQFPINLEKALTYTSSKRGFQIVFPSPNISYDSANVATNLDINGVNCSVQMNVIVYKDKANIDINPSVKIYECRVKSSAVIPDNYLVRTLDDGRAYLIEVVDPSRVDFANNITISAL